MNIILFGAHPDDLEILCAGTIAKYVSQGHRVTMAVATNGNVGSPTLSREEIREVRMQEAKDAATILGAHDFIWLDENDEFLFDNEPAGRNDADLFRLQLLDALNFETEEEKTERNANVVSSFMEHCKENGMVIPDTMFESYFGA